MNKIFVFIIMTLSTAFSILAIIGLIIITPILRLREYMRAREKEGKRWIDPAESEKKSEGGGE